MTLHGLDWAIIVGYLAIALAVGLRLRSRAAGSLGDYFASGRSLPWWIAGTSMVATTFAADTPLAVTALTARHGLAGNWFWWAFALGGMVTVFVYARLWRRAEVLTDVELVELRYGGRPAAFLRGCRAVYVALLVNAIIIGWVTGAMVTVLEHTVWADSSAASASGEWWVILGLLAVVAVYSTVAGLWGVVVTDLLQFVVAMAGCTGLAWLAVREVGGIGALRERVAANFEGGEQAFAYLPQFGSDLAWMPLHVFLIMLFVQWWASWYPGAEPGGGGYVVQRMASARDERHSLLATLWFQIAHYCVRPWPWLMVAFVALALYPDLRAMDDPGVGFPMVIRDIAPPGLRGLMLVAFFAAFMSTVSTQMNWGASYLVSDVWVRFARPNASRRELTTAARLASLVVLGVGSVAAWLMRDVSVDQAWKFLAAMGAGTGAVFMLRWFWWRINAWSEISAMVASLTFVLLVGDRFGSEEVRLAIVAALTVAVWLAVTLTTRPESDETLLAFFRKVRPGGPGWGRFAAASPDTARDTHLGASLASAVLAASMIYLTLPGIGLLLLGPVWRGVICLLGAAGCAAAVFAILQRAGWSEVVR